MRKWWWCMGWKIKVDYISLKKEECNKADITNAKEVVRYLSGFYHMLF